MKQTLLIFLFISTLAFANSSKKTLLNDLISIQDLVNTVIANQLESKIVQGKKYVFDRSALCYDLAEADGQLYLLERVIYRTFGENNVTFDLQDKLTAPQNYFRLKCLNSQSSLDDFIAIIDEYNQKIEQIYQLIEN